VTQPDPPLTHPGPLAADEPAVGPAVVEAAVVETDAVGLGPTTAADDAGEPASGPRRSVGPAVPPARGWTAGDLRVEVWLVLGVSLGASAVFAVINLIGRLTAPVPLSQSTATLNGSYAPTRPLLDLSLQLASIAFQVMPALLALHLLRRAGTPPAGIGLDNRRLRRDLGWGAGLAAAIGIPGLLLYLGAHALGISATVVPEALPPVWWRIPVLVLSAAGNAVLEEIVVVGYLITRLEQLRWRRTSTLLASAVLRGSYHLYQGFGAFIGNAVMGLLFGWLFQRTRRLLPLIIAHTLIDTVTFVGYAALHGRVSWLP
jgi:membrane protease YdiL (CAAX protease family)